MTSSGDGSVIHRLNGLYLYYGVQFLNNQHLNMFFFSTIFSLTPETVEVNTSFRKVFKFAVDLGTSTTEQTMISTFINYKTKYLQRQFGKKEIKASVCSRCLQLTEHSSAFAESYS